MTLQFGIFENFKNSDTLLIWGDEPELSKFAFLLNELAEGITRSVTFQDLP